MGSTEWVEHHAAELQSKAVAYINSDGNGRGFLGAQGSHAFMPLMTEISQSVTDPETGVSIFERAKALKAANANSVAAKKEAFEAAQYPLGAMGSGSDYSSFIQHLGVPSLNIGFGGEDEGGEYHSIYDSYDMYTRFKDPSFVYGVTLAQTVGRAVLRLSDADALPFDFQHLQKTVKGYIYELIKNVDQMRETAKLENELVKNKVYVYAADPIEKLKTQEMVAEVPYVDFAPILNALSHFEKAATRVEALKRTADATKLKELNIKLYQAEQQLLTKEGLPRRPWYKHSLYAPGFYTGYGVKTVPGVREAIEQKNWTEAKEQINEVSKSIERLAVYLEQL
jgi:N-acetylated-alpha-linked acidic dipeptidase